MLGKGARCCKNRKTSRDHSIYSIVVIGLNIEKIPGDTRKLDVSQTSERYHQSYVDLASELNKFLLYLKLY